LPTPNAAAINVTLAPGNYQFRVRATDGAGNLGSFATTAVFAVAVQQETSTSIVYGGTWTATTLAGASGGSVKFAGAAGNTAKFSVTGTNVSWVTTKGPNRGIAQVFVDGSATPAATIDLFAAVVNPRRIVWSRNGLAAGTHTITVRVTGTKNVSSTGTRVDIDAFTVLR
jgi:hypothetical protein